MVEYSSNRSHLNSTLFSEFPVSTGGEVDRNVYGGTAKTILDTFEVVTPFLPDTYILGCKAVNSANVIESIIIVDNKISQEDWEIQLVTLDNNDSRANQKEIILDYIKGTDPANSYYSMYPTYIYILDTDFFALKNVGSVAVPVGTKFLMKGIYVRG